MITTLVAQRARRPGHERGPIRVLHPEIRG